MDTIAPEPVMNEAEFATLLEVFRRRRAVEFTTGTLNLKVVHNIDFLMTIDRSVIMRTPTVRLWYVINST